MRIALIAVAALHVAASSAVAQAPDGARVRLDFIMTYSENSSKKFDISQTRNTFKRVLKGSCTLEAAGIMPYGLEGPTDEEQKAMSTPDAGMASLEREVKKCGTDQTCIQRVMQKASGQDFQAPPSAAGGAYQIWHPKFCGGDFTVEDVAWLRTFDPAVGWGEKTTTTKGQSKIEALEEDGWEAARIEHDLNRKSSKYWFGLPLEGAKMQRNVSTKSGSQNSTAVVRLVDGPYPGPFHMIPGPPKAGKASHKIGDGALTIEWTITKKP
jgi:hypothetical protein